MEIEYVTTRLYLEQIYNGFCKDYRVDPKMPIGEKFFRRQLRERSLQDLITFCKERGIGCVDARTKDKKNGLKKGGTFETWIDTFTLAQDIVLCLTNDFYEGVKTQEKEKETLLSCNGKDGRVNMYKLKLDKRTGKPAVILINDPTALDGLPDFKVPPARKEWESAIDYANRVAEESAYRKIEKAAILYDLTGHNDGPTDDMSDDEEAEPPARSIKDYFHFPD